MAGKAHAMMVDGDGALWAYSVEEHPYDAAFCALQCLNDGSWVHDEGTVARFATVKEALLNALEMQLVALA